MQPEHINRHGRRTYNTLTRLDRRGYAGAMPPLGRRRYVSYTPRLDAWCDAHPRLTEALIGAVFVGLMLAVVGVDLAWG